MKVRNMTGKNGRAIPNQFIIEDSFKFTNNERQKKTGTVVVFQSYDSIIIRIEYRGWRKTTLLDKQKWDYSVTTGKYRNLFLGETKKQTEKKIKDGTYILTNLN